MSDTPATIPEISFPEHLPVSARRADIAAALAAHQVVIVCGETGSGKTTQLPKIALAMGRGAKAPGARGQKTTSMIGMTQPRRIAAKSVAHRIAEETNSRLGGLIGWQVRFTDQVSDETRIKVMTDGILLAETQSDPEFRAYDTLILDEAHERSLNVDFLLGYLKTLLPRRPDLKVIVSSATLEADRFSAYFNGAPVVEVSGRTYPVEIRYRTVSAGAPAGKDANATDEPDLDAALLHAVDELAAEGPGDILVFLPGEREIREAQEDLRKHHPPHTEILPLFARLSVSEQEMIFAAHSGRRIVLATNVAETSLTVPGIRYVVDAGQARIKRYSLRNKIEQLKIENISQASANQRAGRCGRVADGICIRLYDEQDFQSRPKYTTPELLRSSLAGVILRMKSLHLPEIDAFPFLDPPDGKRIRDGQQLLAELGALNEAGQLTAIGKQLAKLPVDPRIGRMLIAARDKACLHEMLVIAAYLSVQDPRERPLDRQEAADQKHRRFTDPDSDFVSILKLWQHIDALNTHRKSQKKLREALKADFISPLRVREWRDVLGQLAAQVKELGWKVEEPRCELTPTAPPDAATYAPLHQALLSGLLGNLGLLTEEGVYLGAREVKFALFPGSGVKKKPKWVMAAEIVETRRVYARTLAKIEPEWVEHAARHLLKISYADPHWAKKPAHVAAAMRATLYGLPVVNGRQVHYGPIDPVLSRELFIRGALVNGEMGNNMDSRAPFFLHNQQLLEEIDDLAHRSRNARLTVDEHVLYAFFDARIPEGMHNGAAFEKWRREAEKKQPRLLFLERDDLFATDQRTSTEDFPVALEFNGIPYTLAYRFDPGTPDDGVTLTIPLPALNQVPALACEWLVPGLLEEKIIALIKTLPQSVRRAFIPVPDYARAAASALSENKGGGRKGAGLVETLASFLTQTTGQPIPRDAWRMEALPAHLAMNFRVADERGKPLAEGRDLAELRRKLGGAASQELARSANPFERDDLKCWDFDDLPETLEVMANGRPVAAFPALVAVEDRVRLTLFDSPANARWTHRNGVARLLWLSFPDLLRQSERDLLLRLKPTCLKYALLFKGGRCETLVRDVLAASAGSLLATPATLTTPAAPLRTRAAFESACQAARPRLPGAVIQCAQIAMEAVEAAHRVTLALDKAPAAWKTAVLDLRGQLSELVFPGFMAAHPPAALLHLPRYLKAMELRLGKLANQTARDQSAMNEMAGLQAAWRTRNERQDAHSVDLALADFRWLLEELRVSLFAQELRTPEPVSVKRLEKRWAELTR